MTEKRIDNDIKQDYCSLAIAKLLKTAGFDVACDLYYEVALTSRKDKQDGYTGSFGWRKGETSVHNDYNTNTSLKKYYDDKNWSAWSKPTVAVAMNWITKNFGIQMFPAYNFYDGFHYGYKWVKPDGSYGEVWKDGRGEPDGYDTVSEATEAMLEHALTKLINK